MGAKATDRFPCHRIRVIVNATCDTINGSSIPRRCVVEPSDLRSVQSKDFKDGLEIGRAPAFTKEEHLRPCQRRGNWMVGAGLSGQVHCIAPDASALTRSHAAISMRGWDWLGDHGSGAEHRNPGRGYPVDKKAGGER